MMTTLRTLPMVTLGALVLSWLASGRTACADGVVLALSPDDQQEITARLGAGVVGQAVASQPITDPSVYFPLREKALTYQVTAGSNAGKIQVLHLARSTRPNGNPAWRFQLSPTLAAFIRTAPNGDLVIPAVSDTDHGVVVVTTPANPFLPKGMNPGDTRPFSQTVAINYLDDPTTQDYSGTLTGTYTYVGTYQVTVPAGTYSAVLMRTRCEGKIGPAHTQDTAYYFFAPGVGVVAMITQEDVEAFWIIHLDTTIGKVLASS